MARQPVRVQIFNQTYTLLADGNPREVEELAQQIDELMVNIASRTSSGDSTRVAVLACMHLADKLRTANQQLEEVQSCSGRMAEILEKTLAEAVEPG